MQTINLPKPPTEESLPLLLRARLMLGHALEHASQKTEFDNMIAILGLDNTIEYMLRAVVTHLDLEGVTGKPFADIELASLAAEINKALSDLAAVRLPYMAEIKLLRQTRNLVQHGAVAPYADLERFGKITQRFMDQTLTKIFGLKADELRISSIIEDEAAKAFLQKAEGLIEKGKWLDAVVASRNAFENARFGRLKHADISLALYPGILQASEQHDIASAMEAIKEELDLAYLGINTPEYRRFKEYLDHIPRKYCSKDGWGSIAMQRPWQREDALFCYNYAAGVILRWQARETEKLCTPKLNSRFHLAFTIADIRLGSEADGECVVSYSHGRWQFLFYTSLAKKRRFEKLKKNKLYKYNMVSYVDDEKQAPRQATFELLGVYTFLATNRPERWGVLVWYRTGDGECVFGQPSPAKESNKPVHNRRSQPFNPCR